MNFLGAFRRQTGPRPVEEARTTETPAFHSVSDMHVGLVRAINEDRLLDRPDAGLWAVADGMGGHSGGDAAATTAIRALDRYASGSAGVSKASVLAALEQANREIRANAGAGETSGCTVVGMSADGGGFHIFWAGDSRAYRYRDGALELLTHDHSLVQQLVDAKALTPDQAIGHPQSHVITRALGNAEEIEIDSVTDKLRVGDRFLLCSDGLWGMVPHGGIAEAMTLPIESAVTRLTRAALDGGGTDNLSMVAIQVGELAPDRT